MLTPGALTSGLKPRSMLFGPADEKSAITSSFVTAAAVIALAASPGDVRRMLGLGGVEWARGVLPGRTRRWKRACDDYLRCRKRPVPLRKAAGHREPRRVEEDVGLVNPVVDDPDLDPLSRGCQSGAP